MSQPSSSLDWARTELRDSEAFIDRTLHSKPWGKTELLVSSNQKWVLKTASPGIFPHAIDMCRLVSQIRADFVAPIRAGIAVGTEQWTLFPYVASRELRADDSDLPHALSAVSRLAAIQRDAIPFAPPGCGRFARDTVEEFNLFTADLSSDTQAWWLNGMSKILEVAAIVDSSAPTSLDHPDLNPSNIFIDELGTVRIIDWEETTWGCPMFSLDRLLDEPWSAQATTAIRRAYLHDIGIEDESVLNLALIIAPIRRAIEARQFARALSLGHPHTRYVEKLLGSTKVRLSQYAADAGQP